MIFQEDIHHIKQSRYLNQATKSESQTHSTECTERAFTCGTKSYVAKNKKMSEMSGCQELGGQGGEAGGEEG